MGHFDTVPCFQIAEELSFDVETRMAGNDHICDQGVFKSYVMLAENCFMPSGSTHSVQVL